MLIRSAIDADAEAIARVHVRSWQAAYRDLLPHELLDGLSVDTRAEQWRSILGANARTGQTTLVAESGGAVVAFAHLGPCRDEDAGAEVGEVYAIYADPDRFGDGLGRGLMTKATAVLAANGFCTATLWVLAGNARAIAFYRAAGFAAEGISRDEQLRGCPVVERRYRRSLGAVPE